MAEAMKVGFMGSQAELDGEVKIIKIHHIHTGNGPKLSAAHAHSEHLPPHLGSALLQHATRL